MGIKQPDPIEQIFKSETIDFILEYTSGPSCAKQVEINDVNNAKASCPSEPVLQNDVNYSNVSSPSEPVFENGINDTNAPCFSRQEIQNRVNFINALCFCGLVFPNDVNNIDATSCSSGQVLENSTNPTNTPCSSGQDFQNRVNFTNAPCFSGLIFPKECVGVKGDSRKRRAHAPSNGRCQCYQPFVTHFALGWYATAFRVTPSPRSHWWFLGNRRELHSVTSVNDVGSAQALCSTWIDG
ncbi:hypothetical protein CDAR_276241 [Caerostris darwini]|uniref:Uncharacterized protein n=1 Tax=Caerostris darwini TaxID=1538125 RepID=A0AAV4PW23_9ARAC|nr:hypothetical protein CDAR_276241 [Caerostris darwini]